MESANSKGHITAFVTPGWGHNKPLTVLLAKLARHSHVHVTFFTGVSAYDRVLREVEKQFLPQGEENLKSLVRVVGLPQPQNPLDFGTLAQTFIKSYKLLCDGHPISAMPEGSDKHQPLGPPQLVLLDLFLYEAMKPIKEISGNTTPIYAWQSCSTAATIFLSGPEHLGGNGDLAKKLEAITAVDEQERFDEAQKLYRRINRDLLNIPGLPPMYDYEFSPQKLIIPADVANLTRDVHRLLLECDGSIHCTNPAYEGPALDAWAKWLPKGPTIAIGPIATPPELERIHDTREPSDTDIEVKAFLDSALNKCGENSVVYMSFGTQFWSTEPDKIWIVLGVLVELNIPFLFSYASPFAVIPDEIKQKAAESGLGYMSKWLPQQMILDHSACGWFLSHGGQNSVMESLSAGVPIIFWPFDADQPANAALVSIIHEAGYELVEARQGIALQPMHRLNGRTPEGSVEALRKEAIETFAKARGEDGKLRRMNAQRLGKQFADYWAPDGDGWKELQRITDVLH